MTRVPESSGRLWLGVATLLAGTLLPPLDFFIVNLAIPSIQADLGGSEVLGQQIVAAYAATYAVTLTVGGRVGDLYGRRRVFLIGLIGFALASLICGMTTSALILVMGRVLQGLTAALMAPQSLALIRASLTGPQQSVALGIHGATFGLAAVVGQSLGGFLVAADLFGWGWRTIFLINLPVAVLAVVGSCFLRAPRPESAGRLDIGGALLLFGGLAGIVVPLLEGRMLGWPWWCWALFVVAGLLLVMFWRRQRHLDGELVTMKNHTVPLVPPAAVTAPGVRTALTAIVLFYSIAAFFLIFSAYQQSHDRTPLQAGLDILPLGIGFLIGPLTVSRLSRILPRGIAALGLCLEALGFVVFGGLIAWNPETRWIALPLAVIGFGQGLALPSLIRLSVNHTPRRYAGLASGLVNAVLQISAAFSVAIIGGVYYTVSDSTGETPAIITSVALIAMLLVVAALLAHRVSAVPETTENPEPADTDSADSPPERNHPRPAPSNRRCSCTDGASSPSQQD